MTERDPALEPFDALIGAWATEATHPLFDGVVAGSSTFDWLEGGHFVVQRSHNDHELFPDAICVIGPPEAGEGLVMEYFDSRGVRRTYGASLDEGVLRIWRDAPGFDQRFSATLDHDSFEGLWQLAETPGEWKDDLKVTYRRRSPRPPRTTIDDLLARARTNLVRVGPQEARAAMRAGALLLDIRSESQRAADGVVTGSLWFERNVLEWRCDPLSEGRDERIADFGRQLIVMCDEGYQSSLAAATLQQLGFTRVTDLAGGFRAWLAAGLPVSGSERDRDAAQVRPVE